MNLRIEEKEAFAVFGLEKCRFAYMICALVREGCQADGYKIALVPQATWAVFRGRQADHPAKHISRLYN